MLWTTIPKTQGKEQYCSANHYESLIIPYLPRLNSFEHTGLVLYLQAYKLQRGECGIRGKTLPRKSDDDTGNIYSA